jgi:hypothetical protein
VEDPNHVEEGESEEDLDGGIDYVSTPVTTDE